MDHRTSSIVALPLQLALVFVTRAHGSYKEELSILTILSKCMKEIYENLMQAFKTLSGGGERDLFGVSIKGCLATRASYL